MYPSARISKCGTYDNRIRPWYVTTATPSPKNIVILLDSSTSMGDHNNLDAAKDTAKTVLNTLNPQDKVHKCELSCSCLPYFPFLTGSLLPVNQSDHESIDRLMFRQ